MKERQGRPLLRLRRTLTVENLWLYVLSLLSKEKKHGYTVAEDISKRFGWSPGFITPYVVLYKLEEDGYISSKNDGRRVYYAITQKGKEILKEARRMLRTTAKVI